MNKLPVGKKFFPLINPSENLVNKFNVFTLDFIERTKKISSEMIDASVHGEFFSPSSIRGADNIHIASEYKTLNGYPAIRVNSRHDFLSKVSSGMKTYTKHLAKFYTTTERYPEIDNLPFFKGVIYQWDSVKKGIWVLNMPYEGKLVPSKDSAKVKRELKDIFDDAINKVETLTVLGAPIATQYSSNIWNERECIRMLVNKEEIPDKDLFNLLEHVGVLSGKHNWQAPSDQRYEFTLKKNPKFKIHSHTRTNILFEMGGLELPEDYQDWFD